MQSVEEGVHQLPLLAAQSPHLVVEEAVEAHAPKPELSAAPSHLSLPIGPQRERSVAAADRVFPEVGKLLAAAAEIAGEKKLCPLRQDGVLRPGGESPPTLRDTAPELRANH